MNTSQKQRLLRMQMGSSVHGRGTRKPTYNNMALCYDLRTLIYELKHTEYMMLIEKIKSINSKNFNWLKSQWFPENLLQMHRGYNKTINDGGGRLLLWYANLIEVYATRIQSFLGYRNEFEKNFINGDYQAAEESLNRLDEEVGVSLWSIESRFSLLEYSGGVEKNKEYLDEISSSEADSWVKVYAYFFSFKAERGISQRQYDHRIKSYLSKYKHDFKAAFTEKLFPFSDFPITDVEDVLENIFTFPVIDIYISFIKVCARVLTDEDLSVDDLQIVNQALSYIINIDDIVLHKLQLFAGVKNDLMEGENDKSYIELSDLYTSGEYKKLIRSAETKIIEYPNCFELYELYIKSHIMSNCKFICNDAEIPKNELMTAMYSSYVKDKDTPKAYYLISRLSRLFTNSYFGVSIEYFLMDKYSVGLDTELSNGKELFSSINSIKMMAMNDSLKGITINYYNRIKKNSETVNLFSYVYFGTAAVMEGVDQNRYRWYEIKKRLKDNDKEVWRDIEAWYKELAKDTSVYASYQKERLSTELYYLYIGEGKFLNAEELLVDETIRNQFCSLRMDLDVLFERIGPKTMELKKSICTPIAASFFYKGDDYTNVFSTVANFLSANGLQKPSDLFGQEQKYGTDRLHYFLKQVCIREVIDSMFDVFESEIDVDNERIDICRYLQVNDTDNSNDYINEISQILQRRRILEGVKYFEEDKIELDFENIFNSQREMFEAGYKRFLQFNLLSKDYAAYAVINDKLYVFSEESETYSLAFVAFKELLEDYRQELAFGTFGLDQIIGTRIRHGHLQNNIRIAFENNNIAFISKSSTDRTYLPSSYIEDLCNNLDKNNKDQIYGYISAFSKSIDEYIEKINKCYLRIKIDDKNEQGLFDFSISPSDVMIIMEMAKKYQNINLVKELFEETWKHIIENNLKVVESFFEIRVKSYFIKLLDELASNIKKMQEIGVVQTFFMDAISRARTEMQKSITLICGWFRMSKEQSYDNYTVEELVNICEEINKRAVPNYEEVVLDKFINVTSKFKGKTFSHMVDILIILFTNAFYHSGFINALNQLKLSLKIEEVDDAIELTMRNNLCESVDLDALAKTVNDQRLKVEECIKKREYYNYEGKSGYIKICKILDYNLYTKSYLGFGLDENEASYYVIINMPKTYIIDGGGYNEIDFDRG